MARKVPGGHHRHHQLHQLRRLETGQPGNGQPTLRALGTNANQQYRCQSYQAGSKQPGRPTPEHSRVELGEHEHYHKGHAHPDALCFHNLQVAVGPAVQNK